MLKTLDKSHHAYSCLVEIPAPRGRRFQLRSRLPEFFGNEMNNTIFDLELTRDT
jgi:hypothetical protein